jgi:RNA polymerase sigma-70 factor (ECF subfamily)
MPSLLQTLFLTMRPSLVRFLTLRGASPDESEDLAQDLFIKAGLLEERPIGEPGAYLYKMADNLFLDRRRSALRRQRREEDWADHSGNFDAEVGQVHADHQLAMRHQLAVIEDALSSLPDRTADIFRRFRIDGERQKAIANDLGISVSAVEKHLHRAYDVVLRAKAQIDADDLTQPIQTMKAEFRG